MNQISRYILAELLKVFSLLLLGMTALIIVGVVGQEAVRQGLGPIAIMRLIPYMLPNALLFAVPGTILFAVCSVFGRMSRDNEIVSLKSLGISPREAIKPALYLSCLLSALTVCLNDVAVSWGRNGAARVVIQSVEEVAYGMLRSQRSYATSRFSIVVEKVEDRRLIHPTVVRYNAEKDAPITLMAEEAELKSDLENNKLVVELKDGEIDFYGDIRYKFDMQTYEIPLLEASKKGRDVGKASNLPMGRIPAAIAAQEKIVTETQQALAFEAAFEMISGGFGTLTSGEWSQKRQSLVAVHQQIARLKVVPWRRWANGFSCLCFVAVGAPLAIRLRNADLFTSFGLCFLPILIVYYPILAMTLDKAKAGQWPPYSVWLSNLVLLTVGLFLYQKVRRY